MPGSPDRQLGRHLPQLDGFRGLAILLVVAGHSLEEKNGETGLGLLGVLLFFVLSGFLITGLLQTELIRDGRISLSMFYTRRAFRLFPALFVYLAVLCVLILCHLITDVPWYSVAACILYVRNIWGRGSGTGHIWSLSIEEQFYMVWPLIVNWMGSVRALYVAILGTLAVSGFRMVAIMNHWLPAAMPTAFLYRPWFRFDSILIGCAISLWLNRPDRSSSWRPGRFFKLVPLLCWPALLVVTFAVPVGSIWKLSVQTLLTAVIFLHLILSEGSYSQSFFSHPWLRWFGRMSYSWYLWQQLFTQYWNPTWGGLRTFPMNVLASLAIAVMSFTFIEQPFLRLRDRLHKTRRPLNPVSQPV